MFGVGIVFVLIFSPITIAIWSFGGGCAIPFDYCMADTFYIIVAAPFAMFTQGLAMRQKAFQDYAPQDRQKGQDWYYEIKAYAPFSPFQLFAVSPFHPRCMLCGSSRDFTISYSLIIASISPSRAAANQACSAFAIFPPIPN